MVTNIRNNKSAVGERVDHISGLFVNLDFVEGPRSPREFNSRGVTREFTNPSKFNLEFMDD